MFKNIRLLILGVVIFAIVDEAESGVLTDAFKDFVEKASCNMNALSNSIFSRQQQGDKPCKPKTQNGPTQQEIPVTENSQAGISPSTVTSQEGRNLISAGGNCPSGYRATPSGKCLQIY